MKCPKCGGRLTVKGSRSTSDSVYRHRVCPVCGDEIFTTEKQIITSKYDYNRADLEYKRQMEAIRNERLNYKHI